MYPPQGRQEHAGRSRRGRDGLLAGALVALLGLLGCGGQDSAPGERETAAPPPGREPAAPAERPQAERSRAPKAERPRAPKATGSTGGLSRGDPKGIDDAIPARYLPEGFILPSPAEASEGFGGGKPAYGGFILEVDASVEELRRFLKQEYATDGWQEINDSSVKVDGREGFSLQFGKDRSERTAAFRAEEKRSGAIVDVTYANRSKL